MGLLCLEKTHSSFHTKAFRTASAKRIGGFLSTSGLKRSLRLKKKQKKKKEKATIQVAPSWSSRYTLHVTQKQQHFHLMCSRSLHCAVLGEYSTKGKLCFEDQKHLHIFFYFKTIFKNKSLYTWSERKGNCAATALLFPAPPHMAAQSGACICNVFRLKMDTYSSQVLQLAKVQDAF